MDKLKFYIYTKKCYISVNTLVRGIFFSQFIVVKKIYKMVQKKHNNCNSLREIGYFVWKILKITIFFIENGIYLHDE